MLRCVFNIPLLALLLSIAAPSTASACGPDTDCMIGERKYRIRMAEGHDGRTPVGAIVFAHGYRGSASGTMRNKSLIEIASELGVALIATKSAGPDWALPGAPSPGAPKNVDEPAYYDRVIADAAARLPIDTSRLMATGFSAGGMMVWNLVCHRSESFAAFAPMAGTFWQPEPDTCTTPAATVLHIHGDRDRIVPLEGRAIADTRQGNVHDVLTMYTRYGEYGPASELPMDGFRCQSRTNPDGEVLDFCVFSGGHSFKSVFVRQAWERFTELGRL